MSLVYDSILRLMRTKGDRPLIVVAGGGQWALQYAHALHWFIAQQKAVAMFIYDSEYGLAHDGYHRYLTYTLANMIRAEELGALCIDYSKLTRDEQDALPRATQPRAVFIVTPPDTHCRNASQWVDHANFVLIEKPFDTSPQNILTLKQRLSNSTTTVLGFDHYAARLKPFLTPAVLPDYGIRDCASFEFEMFEAAPRGLEERKPSISTSGMIFDMASHALPLLGWLARDMNDFTRFELKVSTLLSPSNQRYIPAETFGKITFQFTPRHEFGNRHISTEIRIGKGVGLVDSKVVILTDQSGEQLFLDQWFMLAHAKTKTIPIHERVIHRLVDKVIDSHADVQSADGVFDIELGAAIVDTLAAWTRDVQARIQGNELLPTYSQGMTCKEILTSALTLPSSVS